jgi:RHS repeat-associated protein
MSRWCNIATNGFTPATHDLLGPSGEKFLSLDGNDNWLSTNIYAHGELVATYDAAGTHYNFSDWLGTRRMQTDIHGNPQEVCMGGAFGEVNCPMPSADPTHFADKDRDTESGLDDFGARYYNSALGRFMSPGLEREGGSNPIRGPHEPAEPEPLQLCPQPSMEQCRSGWS